MVALAAMLLASAGGCSPFRSSDSVAPAAVTSAAPVHHEVEDNAFPVSVAHRYGETLLAEPPDRIVTLGLHDQDTLISLDLRPVGIRDWPGTGRTYADMPWAPEDVRPGEPPVASPRETIDFDAVAALHPDLITAVHSDLSQADYEHLSEIAPTIAQPKDTPDFQSSWQEETRLMSRAVGRPRQAQTVIDDIEDTFASVREQFPVLADADVALVEYRANGSLRLINPYDPRARMLAALGMRFPDEVAQAVEDAEFDAGTDLAELAELPGLDAIVWLADPAAGTDAAAAADDLRADPAYAELDAVRRGGSVFLSDSDAVSFTSGLSTAYAAERNGKALARALAAKAEADRDSVDPGALLPSGSVARAKARRTASPPATARPSATARVSATPGITSDTITPDTITPDTTTPDPAATDPATNYWHFGPGPTPTVTG